MREQYHAQPRTHSFCAHAHEKQGCVMNHLRRNIVEQVSEQGMGGGGAPHRQREEQKEQKSWLGQVSVEETDNSSQKKQEKLV